MYRADSVLLHDSMPTLTAIHNQSVIEDSDENLGDPQQFQNQRKDKKKFKSPMKQTNGPGGATSKRTTIPIESFTPINRD